MCRVVENDTNNTISLKYEVAANSRKALYTWRINCKQNLIKESNLKRNGCSEPAFLYPCCTTLMTILKTSFSVPVSPLNL